MGPYSPLRAPHDDGTPERDGVGLSQQRAALATKLQSISEPEELEVNSPFSILRKRNQKACLLFQRLRLKKKVPSHR